MSDISGGHWGGDAGVSDMSHSYGGAWGTDNTSAGGDQNGEQTKADDAPSVHSAHTSHTANTGAQFGMHPSAYSGHPGDQQGNSAAQPAPFGGYPMGATPSTAMVPAPSTGGYDYGMDLMGMGAMAPMGAPIPEAQPAAFAPAPTPVHPPNVPKSPTVAEVEAIKREALNAEKSFRQSKELVDTLSEQVQNLEMVAKQAEDNLQAAEKKKGSFTAKSKKKKEVAAAQEQAAAERQKVEEARQQLAAAKK